MSQSVTRKHVVNQIKILGKTYGYFIPSDSECRPPETKQKHYIYGPLGTHLQRNILEEWRKSIFQEFSNVFQVQNGTLVNGDDSLSAKMMITPMHNDGGKRNKDSCEMTHIKDISQYHNQLLKLMKGQLPFGLIHVGSCFKNLHNDELNMPIADSSIFTEAIFQYFVPESESSQCLDQLHDLRMRWWKKFSRFQASFSDTEKEIDNGGHQVSILYDLSTLPTDETIDDCDGGKNAICLERISNQANSPFHDDGCLFKQRQVRNRLIESRFYLEDAMLMYLLDAYAEKCHPSWINEKSDISEIRKLLQIHPKLAPVKAAIVLSCEGEFRQPLEELAEYLGSEIQNRGLSVYQMHKDRLGVSSQIIVNDLLGIPLTIQLDASTLQTGRALLRHRDSAANETVNLMKIIDRIKLYCNCT